MGRAGQEKTEIEIVQRISNKSFFLFNGITAKKKESDVQ